VSTIPVSVAAVFAVTAVVTVVAFNVPPLVTLF
jgi:hypothetical protein